MTIEQPRSVLIVEDERIVAKDLQQTLSDLGYDAYAIAASADEAIARASERCPDVVLMDIRIRGKLDGIQTAEILRRQFGVPVVYLTAHADDATVERAKRTEPYGYLLKPIKSAELRSAIEVCLYKHEMEKRLRERERWLSTTLESVTDAVVSVDLAGRVTFMNSVAETLTGTTAADAVGRSAGEILRLMEGRYTRHRDLLQPLAAGGSASETPDADVRRGRGAVSSHMPSHIKDSVAPVIHDGQKLGTVMVFRDVTQQQHLQKQLELSDRLASLGTMAAGVAHEINNPLAIVVANSEFIADELKQQEADLSYPPAPEAVALRLAEAVLALNDLYTAANRIGRIVADLQTFSRPTQANAGVVDLAKCLEWAVRTTAHELRQRARLITRFGDVPLVRADEAKLGQVFINLLVNAAHSIPLGSVDRNEIVITTRTDERGWLAVEISDTGAGIPKDIIGRIFEPFFTTKEVGVGTGLGLSICFGIMTALGGDLQVVSEPGKGTQFLVLLPPAPNDRPQIDVPDQTPANLLHGRILVVDDEVMVLRMIKRVLSQHEVVCTVSAREALTIIAREEPFDLIFSDLTMPTMTGIEFYETVLARDPELARRIVFLCGGALNAESDDFLRCIQNLHIPKPFDVASLLQTVQQRLSAQGHEARATATTSP
jgi:PAS domain S-box-containing protein